MAVAHLSQAVIDITGNEFEFLDYIDMPGGAGRIPQEELAKFKIDPAANGIEGLEHWPRIKEVDFCGFGLMALKSVHENGDIVWTARRSKSNPGTKSMPVPLIQHNYYSIIQKADEGNYYGHEHSRTHRPFNHNNLLLPIDNRVGPESPIRPLSHLGFHILRITNRGIQQG